MLESTDYTNLWNHLRESISLVKGGEPKPGQGTFSHITGGYDAGYYGCNFCTNTCKFMLTARFRYTYSLVFAADMYATIFKKDPLNPALGKIYRDKILRVGGSKEEIASLTVRGRLFSALVGLKAISGFPWQATEFRRLFEGTLWICSGIKPLNV
jgi:Zn-dependent oligopeptidase